VPMGGGHLGCRFDSSRGGLWLVPPGPFVVLRDDSIPRSVSFSAPQFDFAFARVPCQPLGLTIIFLPPMVKDLTHRFFGRRSRIDFFLFLNMVSFLLTFPPPPTKAPWRQTIYFPHEHFLLPPTPVCVDPPQQGTVFLCPGAWGGQLFLPARIYKKTHPESIRPTFIFTIFLTPSAPPPRVKVPPPPFSSARMPSVCIILTCQVRRTHWGRVNVFPPNSLSPKFCFFYFPFLVFLFHRMEGSHPMRRGVGLVLCVPVYSHWE